MKPIQFESGRLPVSPWRFRRGSAFHRLSIFLGIIVFSSMPAFGQTQDEAGSNAPGDEQEVYSDDVDQREENYRKRMELREDQFRDQPRANTTYTNKAQQGKLDQLPITSQVHIKNQLRDMIIERREWEPGEDLSDYPYALSDEALGDQKLAQKEREAWAEEIEKYQEREAAFAAQAGQPAQSDEGGDSQSADGQQSDQQDGQESGQADMQQTAASEAQKSAASEQQEQDQARQPEEPVISGVSENALSFLRGQGTQPQGDPHGQPPAGDSPKSQGGAKSQASNTPVTDDAAAQNASAAGTDPAGEADASPGAEPGESIAENPGQQTDPAGSLAVSELSQLAGISAPTDTATGLSDANTQSPETSGTEAQNPGDTTPPDAAENALPPLPGTLEIAELEQVRLITVAAPETATAAQPSSGGVSPEDDSR